MRIRNAIKSIVKAIAGGGWEEREKKTHTLRWKKKLIAKRKKKEDLRAIKIENYHFESR